MKNKLTLLILSLFLFACNSSNTSRAVKQKDLIIFGNTLENEGFYDIPFTIVQQDDKNGYLENIVQAVNNSDTLELKISLKKGIKPGFVNGAPKNMFVQEGIIFESKGSKSDNLLNALSAKYGLSQSP